MPLPEDRRELDEVLKEAQYYRVQGLVQHCLNAMQVRTLSLIFFFYSHAMKITNLYSNSFFCFICQKQKDVFETVCRIPMITSAKEEQRMIATCRKVSSAKSVMMTVQFY